MRRALREGFERHAAAAVAPAALLVVVALLGSAGGAALDYRDVTMIVNVVLVVGLYVFVGNSGVFSFGHAAFMAIGAYTWGILRTDPLVKSALMPGLPGFVAHAQVGSFPATLAGGAAAAAFALVIAVPLMRLGGLTAALGTFAVLLIVNIVISNWNDVTHGTAGLDVTATTTRNAALLWALVAIAAAYAFQASSLGLRLRASREDEVAARSVGIGVARTRGAAFVVSAFFVGVGGALTAGQLGSFSPAAFYLPITFLTIAMLVVGGMTSLSGAVVGAIVLSVLSEALRRLETTVSVTGLQEVGFAALLLLILILRPRGITGGREFALPRRLLARREPEPAAAAPAQSSHVHWGTGAGE